MMMLTLLLSAWAGEYKPLCTKIRDSNLVVEVTFQQNAVYPVQHKEKGWAPPEAELLKTAKTGLVSYVFKGSIPLGSPWEPAWGVRFDPGVDSVDAWQQFFDRQSFKQIFFFQQAGNRFSGTGWAEESAPCTTSAHRSWCQEYDKYKAEIVACMAANEVKRVASD